MNYKLKGLIVSRYGSQRAFARKVQISEGLVSYVLKGMALKRHEAERWAAVLDIPKSDVDHFFPVQP